MLTCFNSTMTTLLTARILDKDVPLYGTKVCFGVMVLLVWSWSVAAVIILQSYLSSLYIGLGPGTLFLSSVLLISQGVSNCEAFVWDLARVATSPIWQVLFCNRNSWPKCKNVHMENSRTTDMRFTKFNPCDHRRPEFLECDSYFKGTLSRCSARANLTGFFHRKTIELSLRRVTPTR